MINLNYDLLSDVEVGGIDYSDYPDFSDAYISYALYDGIELTDDELDELSNDYDYVYDEVLKQIY
jgi:hypothetical protein